MTELKKLVSCKTTPIKDCTDKDCNSCCNLYEDNYGIERFCRNCKHVGDNLTCQNCLREISLRITEERDISVQVPKCFERLNGSIEPFNEINKNERISFSGVAQHRHSDVNFWHPKRRMHKE